MRKGYVYLWLTACALSVVTTEGRKLGHGDPPIGTGRIEVGTASMTLQDAYCYVDRVCNRREDPPGPSPESWQRCAPGEIGRWGVCYMVARTKFDRKPTVVVFARKRPMEEQEQWDEKVRIGGEVDCVGAAKGGGPGISLPDRFAGTCEDGRIVTGDVNGEAVINREGARAPSGADGDWGSVDYSATERFLDAHLGANGDGTRYERMRRVSASDDEWRRAVHPGEWAVTRTGAVWLQFPWRYRADSFDVVVREVQESDEPHGVEATLCVTWPGDGESEPDRIDCKQVTLAMKFEGGEFEIAWDELMRALPEEVDVAKAAKRDYPNAPSDDLARPFAARPDSMVTSGIWSVMND